MLATANDGNFKRMQRRRTPEKGEDSFGDRAVALNIQTIFA